MKQFLLWLDQGGNVLCGGNADSTISSCAYAFSSIDTFWSCIEGLINQTFEPIDGPDHCKQSFDNDRDETYTRGGWKRKTGIALLTIPFCLVAALPIYLYSLYKNRTNNDV